ncbi:hypothetical protein Trydic_g1290 [Trypoxylus dichotomus]
MMLYKLHIRPLLTYASPSWVTAALSYIQPLVKVQHRCLLLVLHVIRITALAAPKALADGDELQQLTNCRGFFEKTVASENLALKMATTQDNKRRKTRKNTKDFEDARRHPDDPSKFQEGRYWRRTDRRRKSSQLTILFSEFVLFVSPPLPEE